MEEMGQVWMSQRGDTPMTVFFKPNPPHVATGPRSGPASSVRFAGSLADTPENAKMNPREVLKYRAPKPIRLVQDLLFKFNRFVLMKGLNMTVSPADIQKLRSIPKDAGNM